MIFVAIIFLVLALTNWFSKFPVHLLGWKAILAIFSFCSIAIFCAYWSFRISDKERAESNAIKKTSESVACGKTESGVRVFIHPGQRAMHTQVVGTTNAGKTESVILPWAIQDIRQGRGLIIIDGKSDRGVLEKIYSYACSAGAKDKFKLFSLSSIEESRTFNPLVGVPEEVTEMVFNAFDIENPFYRSIQFEVMVQLLRIFSATGMSPTFERLYEACATPSVLLKVATDLSDSNLKSWLKGFIELPPKDRLERTSGLIAAFGQFAFGRQGTLFNTEEPDIDVSKALKDGEIIYFQLPVLLSPFLGKATGKLVLQAIQNAVANRHRSSGDNKFYSIFLDDFSEYLYPGFVSILNKSRSAKVGVVFAHQALGDIKALGDHVANAILTNSNLKIFMRGSDPESAEYCARLIGTKSTEKLTERTKRSFLGRSDTGDASVREVEEFLIHPNKFKYELGLGEAVVVIPHERGSLVKVVKFEKFPDIQPVPISSPIRRTALNLSEVLKKKGA